MKRKFLALAFVAVMFFGFFKSAESGTGQPCETITTTCPPGMNGAGHGGFMAIVCAPGEWVIWYNYYCTEEEVDD